MEKSAHKVALKPRRKPIQERGRKRVDVILDAVAELLVGKGFDAITTRLIAEKAGIPVGSIYQFFPNKYAIFNALAIRYLDRLTGLYAHVEAPERERLTWEEFFDGGVDALSGVVFSDKAIHILWAGMRNTPELRTAEAEYTAKGVEYNLAILEKPLAHIPVDHRRIVAQVMIRVMDALLYHANEVDTDTRPQVIEELKLILKTYVRSYLEEKA